MKILDILCAPWAILEPRLVEIQDLYFAHTRREKIDLKAWESATGRPAGTDGAPYQVRDGVAILPLQGVLTKSASAWNRLCGMASTAQVRADLLTALEDPAVKSILLWVDSPGGTVDGTQELGDAVFAARDVKPVVAFIDGCGCSAAYWIAAAASQVFISSGTTEVGSIGVVADHVDVSQQDARLGRKVTHITAGKYKRISSSHAPLSQDGQLVMQDTVDYLYSIFVNAISKFRGVSVETVLADMADARVFYGQQAIDAGLVDGVSTMDELISSLSNRGALPPTGAGAASQPTIATPSMETNMDLQELREKHPEIANALLDEGRAQGAASERIRIKGCLDTAIPGYEELAHSAAFDGKSSPAEAALAINAAEKTDLKAAYEKTQSGGVKPLPQGGDPDRSDALSAAKKAEDEKSQANDPKAVWDASADLRAEFSNDYKAYESYLAAEASGQARRLVK